MSTLQIDWNTFQYDNPSVFLMIYNALEEKAKKEATSFFETKGRNGQQDPEDFISFLDRSNWDPNKINKARGELNNLRMGNKQRWNSFFPQWANKLTEAHGNQRPNDVKISLLKGTLNYTLRSALANNHLLPFDNYFEWLRIVGQIAQHYDELAKEKNFPHHLKTKGISAERNRSPEDSGNSRPNYTDKDWNSSGAKDCWWNWLLRRYENGRS